MSAPLVGDYLCSILDVVIPWPRGSLVALRAYLDASERDGGTFCVAALAFGEARAKRATRRWHELWGETRCHMTDLNARPKSGPFGNWTPDRAGERLKDSVAIINRHVSFAVAVSCDVAEIKRLAPKRADPGSKVLQSVFSAAYPFCCHHAMHLLGGMAGGDQLIAYVFEQGDLHQGASQTFIEMMTSQEIGRRSYRHGSHTVTPKENARIFEMTDILAWEWAKHIERVRAGNTDMRKSLKALLNVESGAADDFGFASGTRRATHLHGHILERFYGRLEEVGMFSDNPTLEQARALNQWYAKAQTTLTSDSLW